ncbi:MAG TPA: endolytic transglycosylase MltG [Candidatus Deferrimicrobiaceae bacterium]|nr:endolytic transglycosylase MltG [Candidatus Deferrimicrobiaceae bacterium]
MVSQKLKVALAALFAMACLIAFLLMDTPPSRGWQKTKVVIPKGSSSSDVARLLTAGKVLQHPIVFRTLVLGTMTRKRLRYGEYSFPEPPSVVEIWRKLVGGEVTRYSVTIPEGSNLYDIAKILGDLELVDPHIFLETAASREVLRRLEVPGPTAEGFLFPDTYLLEKTLPAEDILEIMIRQFRRKFPPEWEFRAREEGFSLLQVITIASIIEKETGVAEEKPVVSAVIRKRLTLGMPLQMDPTVIYGLQRFGTELTRKDLHSPSPYNSYLNRGLPPGPIANPGLTAIRAAVFPADTDYLYFVSRNDGSHKFSRTLEEHNQGVASYRRDKTEE